MRHAPFSAVGLIRVHSLLRGCRYHPIRTKDPTMTRLFKSSFVWQFAGGFVLGAIGLFTLHPAQTDTAFDAPTTAQASLQ